MGKKMLRELQIEKEMSIAFTGAGGKTTAVYTCVKEFLNKGVMAVAVTTTKMWEPREGFFLWTKEGSTDQIIRTLHAYGKKPVTIGTELQNGKIGSIPETVMRELMNLGVRLCIEADGAAGKWMKVPRCYEPAVPEWVDVQIGLVNRKAIGKSFLEAAHRPEECAARFGKKEEDLISEDDITRLLLDENGILKGNARRKIAVLSGFAPGEAKPFSNHFQIMINQIRDSGLPLYLWEYDDVKQNNLTSDKRII